MVSTETEYKLARLPIDAVLDAGKLAVWPIHVSKTLYENAVDTAFKVVGVDTIDKPLANGSGVPPGESIYELAKANLDIAAMIYYYTEIRSETKRLLQNFAKDKNMSFEMCHPNEPSDVVKLHSATELVDKCLQAMAATPESTDSSQLLKDYQASLGDLDSLCEQFKLNMGDVEVFKTVRSWCCCVALCLKNCDEIIIRTPTHRESSY